MTACGERGRRFQTVDIGGVGPCTRELTMAVRQHRSMPPHPDIRSYKGRTGRMAAKQQASWAAGGASLLLPEASWSLPGRTVLDIGSGMGESTISLARERPDTTVVAIDVFRRGLANTMHAVMDQNLGNVRVFSGDCMAALADYVSPQSVAQVLVWFPDPWPKRNQQKRRLVRPRFLRLTERVLEPGGELRIATDSADYALKIPHVFAQSPAWQGGVVPRPQWRPITKFEGKANTAGRATTDFAYVVSGPRSS